MSQKKSVIIGAGPAGLTAAYELLKAGRVHVTVLEAEPEVGGISKTINYKGNRIDIGGHRFFSKSDWVMNWWRDMLPVARPDATPSDEQFRIAYQGASRLLGANQMLGRESDRNVMLVRDRTSRIYYGGQFFDYPLKPNFDTVRKLGLMTCASFGASYAYSRAFPLKEEKTLEDFFINRFGYQLYRRFFKEYTEKVWGVPCHDISAEWGAQRIKSLSIGSALKHAVSKWVAPQQNMVATSLIENFLYPKYGPGQMWDVVADKVRAAGGQIILNAKVDAIHWHEGCVTGVDYHHEGLRRGIPLAGGHVISTMPIKDLTAAFRPAPLEIAQVGAQLQYRDFITVGVLYRKLEKTCEAIDARTNLVRDNWIYIQEPGVKVGRLQIFNNWSPCMVQNPDTVWVGLEFFARDDDELWALSDEALKKLALKEMQVLRLAKQDDALDCVVIRMPKAYPAYFGTGYGRFDKIRSYLDGIKNLFLVGRNGMHRYNNQDHSMLSARFAVEAILTGSADKSKIWGVNIHDDYHEEAVAADMVPGSSVQVTQAENERATVWAPSTQSL